MIALIAITPVRAADHIPTVRGPLVCYRVRGNLDAAFAPQGLFMSSPAHVERTSLCGRGCAYNDSDPRFRGRRLIGGVSLVPSWQTACHIERTPTDYYVRVQATLNPSPTLAGCSTNIRSSIFGKPVCRLPAYCGPTVSYAWAEDDWGWASEYLGCVGTGWDYLPERSATPENLLKTGWSRLHRINAPQDCDECGTLLGSYDFDAKTEFGDTERYLLRLSQAVNLPVWDHANGEVRLLQPRVTSGPAGPCLARPQGIPAFIIRPGAYPSYSSRPRSRPDNHKYGVWNGTGGTPDGTGYVMTGNTLVNCDGCVSRPLGFLTTTWDRLGCISDNLVYDHTNVLFSWIVDAFSALLPLVAEIVQSVFQAVVEMIWAVNKHFKLIELSALFGATTLYYDSLPRAGAITVATGALIGFQRSDALSINLPLLGLNVSLGGSRTTTQSTRATARSNPPTATTTPWTGDELTRAAMTTAQDGATVHALSTNTLTPGLSVSLGGLSPTTQTAPATEHYSSSTPAASPWTGDDLTSFATTMDEDGTTVLPPAITGEVTMGVTGSPPAGYTQPLPPSSVMTTEEAMTLTDELVPVQPDEGSEPPYVLALFLSWFWALFG